MVRIVIKRPRLVMNNGEQEGSTSSLYPRPSTESSQPSTSSHPKKRLFTVEDVVKMIEDSDEEEFTEAEDSEDSDWESISSGESDSEYVDPCQEDLQPPSPVSRQGISPIITPDRPKTRQWTSQRPDNLRQPFTPDSFIAPTSVEQPVDYFRLFFSTELTNLVISQTNNFAQNLKAANTTPKARIKKWKPINLNEFFTFIGLLFHMGTIPLSRISDYWSTDFLFRLPLFRACMSRNRFCSILQTLHFSENPTSSQPSQDKLYKIRPLLDIFHATVDSVVPPTKNLCIDESIVLWRGRLMFRVYMEGKRHRYGIKLYMLTDSLGLALRVVVYTGANNKDIWGKGHTDNVARKLLEGKLDKGHSLFMDNCYTRVNLIHQLLQRNTYVTGTQKANRKGNSADVISKKLNRGEAVNAFSDESVCVLKWRDRRDVLMISSEFGANVVDVSDRRGQTVQRPEAVVRYNQSMGGINHLDQMMSYYPIERKTIKWYRKLAIHIFHLCLVNSYFLYNRSQTSRKLFLYDYRLSVIKSLLLPSYNHSPVPMQRPSASSLTGSSHIPQSLTKQPGQTKRKQKKCRVCATKKIRKDSAYYCPACPGKPALCMGECFMAFHRIIK